MIHRRTTLVCCLTLFFLVGRSSWSDAGEAAVWKCGVARRCITPDQPIWMAGYAMRDHVADGKLTDLWAKALMLEDLEGNRALLITLDVCGIDRRLYRAVCDGIRQQSGLEVDQIALCCSHTHSGPALVGNLAPLHYMVVAEEEQKKLEAYESWLESRLIELAGLAIRDLSPCRLAWGSGNANFAVNRRNNAQNEVTAEARNAGRLRGPHDHDVPVLAVRREDDSWKAVVFGYACHATTLAGYEWCGDYPGFAQIDVEAANEGCQAMFWAGCGADQNPLPRRTVELAKEYGDQLAGAVQHVLDGRMQLVSARLTTQLREIDLPLGPLPPDVQWSRDAESTNKYTAARARMLLAQIEAGKPISPTYPYPVQTWRLGDEIQFVTLGGEVVVDFALRLKAELSGSATWVAGYTNDVMAYVASRRVLKEGGYEGGGAMVYYGLPTVWAMESEDRIVDEVHRQLQGE